MRLEGGEGGPPRDVPLRPRNWRYSPSVRWPRHAQRLRNFGGPPRLGDPGASAPPGTAGTAGTRLASGTHRGNFSSRSRLVPTGTSLEALGQCGTGPPGTRGTHGDRDVPGYQALVDTRTDGTVGSLALATRPCRERLAVHGLDAEASRGIAHMYPKGSCN